MQINILVIFLLLGFGYLGFARGFYNMLIHLACVLIAGAIAFAVWEPVGYWFLDMAGGTQWLLDIAWGVALGVPFALALAILLGATAATLRSSARVPPMVDYVGGGALGVASGVIVAGMAVLSMSFCRGQYDFTGFRPVEQQGNGSMVRSAGLWVPVDMITAGLYQHMASNALFEENNLAKYYPDLADRPHMMGTSPENAVLKMGVPENAVDFLGRYTVGQNTAVKWEDLVSDSSDARKQTVMTTANEDTKTLYAGQAYIEGFVVALKSAARESIGQVAVTPGTVTLVMYDRDRDVTEALQPFAMISQARSDPAKPLSFTASRWRFDSKGTVLGSVGGAIEASPMAFEFLVPKRGANYVPLALFVKGLRIDLIDPATQQPVVPKEVLKTVAERDALVPTGEIITPPAGPGDGPTGTGPTVAGASGAVNVTNQMPFSVVLNKGDLKVDTDDKNRLLDGEQAFNSQQLSNRGIERDLRVDRFFSDNDTAMVQIDVGKESALSMLSAAANDATGGPVLVAGTQKFTCIGYVYRDGNLARIRHTKSSPITNKNDLPSLSKSRTDQQLKLLFSVTAGAEITSFQIGDTVIATFSPPIKVTGGQR
ncbi:hypothetical protein BH11PLA1_BH11PLA1_16040 [soil metagenome]